MELEGKKIIVTGGGSGIAAGCVRGYVRAGAQVVFCDVNDEGGKTTEAENDEQLVCRVEITGLEENTTYYYQWYTGTEWSKACKYETKSFDSHKALVIGDIQIGGQTEDSSKQSLDGFTWNNVLAEALTKNPDISYLVSPGDNTSTGKTADELYNDIRRSQNYPLQ